MSQSSKKAIFFFLSTVFFLFVSLESFSTKHEIKNKKIAFDLSTASIDLIEQAIKTEEISCQALITRYITRIKKYNFDVSRGAAINAFAHLNPFALTEAKQLDNQFKVTKKTVGPLHCIPIIVKDNIDTIDSPSTSGSLALLGSQPNKDAFLVKQLKKAGAIIIGKGSMDEFAAGMIGVSSRTGRVGNSYDPTQNPAGSSSGPAAAVSANFALIGIGTDNSGSIRVPAAFNGIYGLRPSTGLISQTGIFPRGNLDGVAGPLTRSVKDMAIVLSIITTPDEDDEKTQHHPIIRAYETLLNKKNLTGVRLGIVRRGADINLFKNTPPKINKLHENFFAKLKNLGATITDITLPDFDVSRKNNMSGEIQQINHYLSSFPSTRKNMKDICLSERTQIFNGVQGCLQHINETASIESKTYRDTLALFAKNRGYVQKIMKKNNLTALIVPISSHGKATYDIGSVNTWKLPLSSNSGLPAIVINIGYTEDKISMPVGMEMIGYFYDEATLLQLADVIEKTSPPQRSPRLTTPSPKYNLTRFNISQINNLLTLIGYNTYMDFLKKDKPEELTPLVFNKILLNTIQMFTARQYLLKEVHKQ